MGMEPEQPPKWGKMLLGVVVAVAVMTLSKVVWGMFLDSR
jgi:hypothetical protein